jgi:hypothetical protein
MIWKQSSKLSWVLHQEGKGVQIQSIVILGGSSIDGLQHSLSPCPVFWFPRWGLEPLNVEYSGDLSNSLVRRTGPTTGSSFSIQVQTVFCLSVFCVKKYAALCAQADIQSFAAWGILLCLKLRQTGYLCELKVYTVWTGVCCK